jgi:hypothetical protein
MNWFEVIKKQSFEGISELDIPRIIEGDVQTNGSDPCCENARTDLLRLLHDWGEVYEQIRRTKRRKIFITVAGERRTVLDTMDYIFPLVEEAECKELRNWIPIFFKMSKTKYKKEFSSVIQGAKDIEAEWARCENELV